MRRSGPHSTLDPIVAGHLRGGDKKAAFQAIFTALGPGVRGFLRAAAHSDAHGDELADELWVRLWQHLEADEDWLSLASAPPAPPDHDDARAAPQEDVRRRGQSVRAFVYRSARNLYLDWIKRASRRNAPLRSDMDVAASAPRMSAVLAAREDAALLGQVLAALSDDERDVLVLRAERDLSFAEVAEALDISAGAAKVRYQRAKEKLRALVADALQRRR